MISVIDTKKIGGGIRVKSTVNYDYNGDTLKTQKFVYSIDGTLTGASSGKLIIKPLNYYIRSVRLWNGASSAQGLYLVRASSTLLPLGFCSPPNSVGYDKVHVLEGEKGKGGKTIYSYHNYETSLVDYIPEIPYNTNSRNGQLKSVEIKNNLNNQLKLTEYFYDLKEQNLIKGVLIFKPRPDPSTNFLYAEGDVKYYNNISEWWVQSSIIENDYQSNGTITKTSSHFYDNLNHKQLTRKVITNSTGESLTTEYKYPHDFISVEPYASMVTCNIISPVIEQLEQVNSVPLQSMKTNYFNPSGSIFVPQTVQQTVGTSTNTKITYNSYDDKGNVTQYTGADGLVVTIFWAYNKTYPVAKIVYGSAFTISDALRNTINNRDYCGTDVKSSIDADISFLAAELSTYITSDSCQVTLYTYKPLVGMTSQTQPNGKTTSEPGITTYFLYDSFGRLSEVKDDDGKLLKKNKYHYATN